MRASANAAGHGGVIIAHRDDDPAQARDASTGIARERIARMKAAR
jgi:hypothetical protein